MIFVVVAAAVVDFTGPRCRIENRVRRSKLRTFSRGKDDMILGLKMHGWGEYYRKACVASGWSRKPPLGRLGDWILSELRSLRHVPGVLPLVADVAEVVLPGIVVAKAVSVPYF